MRRLAVVLASVLALAGCGSSDAIKGIHGEQLPIIDIGSDTLTEVTSPTSAQPYSAKATDKHLLVLYLGYTNCPDVCPTTMSDIRTARQSLSSPDQARVDESFVTVDLANDTPEVLLDYTKRFSFGPSDHTIRPTTEQLLKAQKTLFATSSEGAKAASGIQMMNHTTYTYVVNAQGHVVAEWSYGTPSRNMAHDLKALLKTA